VEEEAREGEGEGREGCKVQGEAWEEAAEISAKTTNAKNMAQFLTLRPAQKILT
jgi:hypothetical protein